MKNKTIVEKIQLYTGNVAYDDFISNSMLVEACVFNLGQIGELANKIDKDFENANSEIPWRVLYGLRNKIAHDYEGVNLVLIWDIVENDLSELYNQLNGLYNKI